MRLEKLAVKLREFWNHWDIQLMVLLSLLLQLILVFLGNRRKFSRNVFLRFLVWCAYISADSIVAFTLGALSRKVGDTWKEPKSLDPNTELNAFWASLLLLLLGGPDTITAYSLEDNELWLRHLLSSTVQTMVVLYIYAIVGSLSDKSLLAFSMILAGLIKCGERVWALLLASREKSGESRLNPRDFCPSYVRFMGKYSLERAEGYHVTFDEIIQLPTHLSTHENQSITDAEELVKAHRLLRTFKHLFSDLQLSKNDSELSLSIFKNRSWESAFKIVEIELAFMYDLIFTKARILYTLWGFFRRAITLSITCFVLAAFSSLSLSGRSSAKRGSDEDVDLVNAVITLVFLAVLILMEIYPLLLLLSSDWIDVWLSKCDENSLFLLAINYLRPSKQRRWSNSMGQFSLLSFCIDEEPLPCYGLLKLLHLDEELNIYQYTHHKPVPDSLKILLFEKIRMKIENRDSDFDHKSTVIRVWNNYSFSHQFWSNDLELDKCILIWHVATEIFSHSIPQYQNKDVHLSNLLSRYMFYLLVRYPFMLSVAIGGVRLRDTFADGKKFSSHKQRLLHNHSQDTVGQACQLLRSLTKDMPTEARNIPVFLHGCRIAEELLKPTDPHKLQLQSYMMCDMWVGLLVCAAAMKQWKGSHHAQQLRRGGELLSHVWLLLAHFGLTDHFEKTEGQFLATMR